MGIKISAVLNTINEEQSIERAIKSVNWADEVVVCDMHSTDQTVELAKKNGAKVIFHDRANFVEPIRNFQISKALGDWILVLDPDEEVPPKLAEKLREIVKSPGDISYVEVPRKNVIFGKWMNASMWWPDYNIRFFKRGFVTWGDKIHRPPKTRGSGMRLPESEELSILHHHYSTVTEYLTRTIRYSQIQASELVESGYKFDWRDLISKPLGEFLGRFFANSGFKDGLHGLVLNMLQAVSFLVVYIRVWEFEKFKTETISLSELKSVSQKSGKEIDYWFKLSMLPSSSVGKIIRKIQDKLLF